VTLSAKLGAELYRLTHRGNPGDVAFYSALCEPAQSVLELGSGYGRLVTALARQDRRLVGLELDRGLLGLARHAVRALPASEQRSVRLVLGDMRRFDLGQTFERVLLPYNGLFCLVNRAEARSCLRSVRRSLTAGGVFALDIWSANELHQRRTDGDHDSQVDDGVSAEPLFGIAHGRQRFRVFEACRFYRGKQRLDVTYSYVPEGRGKQHSRQLPQRYYRSDELSELLEGEGFRVMRRYGSFARTRFTARSQQLVLLATPA